MKKTPSTNRLNYPFLPNEIINLKLTKEEVGVLTARRMYHQSLHGYFNEYGPNGYRKDFIAALLSNGASAALEANEKIKKLPIKEETLYEVIKDNGLTEFDIQTLDEAGIIKIMEGVTNIEGLFSLMAEILDEGCSVLSSPDTNLYSDFLCDDMQEKPEKPDIRAKFRGFTGLFDEICYCVSAPNNFIPFNKTYVPYITVARIPEDRDPGVYRAFLTYKGMELYKFLKERGVGRTDDEKRKIHDIIGSTVMGYGTLGVALSHEILFMNFTVDGIDYGSIWAHSPYAMDTDIGCLFEITGTVVQKTDQDGLKYYALEVIDVQKCPEDECPEDE